MAKTKTSISKKSEPTNRTVTIMVIVAVLTLSLGFVFSKKLIGDFTFNLRVISAKRKADKQLTTNIKNLDELKENYEALKIAGPQPELVLSALPAQSDFPALTSTFELMSAVSGVSLQQISIEGQESSEESPATTPLSNPEPRELVLNIEITGRYEAILTFLGNIENSVRPMRIDRVEVRGEDNIISAEFVLTTYYQPGIDVSPKMEKIQ